MLLPQLRDRSDVSLQWVCTGTGINANALGERLSIPGGPPITARCSRTRA